MCRALRFTFVAFLALDVCVVFAVWRMEGTHSAALLIDIRNALFTTFVSDRSELEAPPQELVQHGFLTDPPELCAEWKHVLNDYVRYRALLEQLETTPSTVDKAKLITLSFSRNGTPVGPTGDPLRPYDKYADLLFKLSTIIEPRGCCSDHTEVFQAIANIVGLDTIEVTCAHHMCRMVSRIKQVGLARSAICPDGKTAYWRISVAVGTARCKLKR